MEIITRFAPGNTLWKKRMESSIVGLAFDALNAGCEIREVSSFAILAVVEQRKHSVFVVVLVDVHIVLLKIFDDLSAFFLAILVLKALISSSEAPFS